jgi:polysaccharide export outer membrane protein
MLNFAFFPNSGTSLMLQSKPRLASAMSALALCLFLLFLGTYVWAQQPTEQPSTQSVTDQAATPGQVATPQTPVAKPDAKTANTSDKPGAGSTPVKLGPGDLVEIGVYGVPELATKARVSNDGDLYLPLIDYVHVSGLSLEEAQRLVEKRLDDGGFVKNPHVTIFVNEYASQAVTVMGEVGKPGVYPILGDRRLFDLLSAAGGLTDKAGRTLTITHRSQPDKPETVHLARNLTDAPETNVDVLAGDTVEVHRAPIIYVVGDVGRPSGLLVDNGNLTVLQAIALAGGTNRTAKLGGTRILRKGDGPNGVTETPVPLKKMLEAKAADIPLQPNDILFVPVSGGKILAGRSLEAVFAMATAVSIYAVHP